MFLLCSYVNTLSAQCTTGSAATSYTSNNGSRGAMFNITAGASSITITSFDANIYGGTTARYEIYYKAGSYVGSETTSGNWTMAGGVNNLTSLGNNVATPIPISLSITIPAGTTYGFYITNTASGGLNYNSSATTGVTLASNSDMTVTGGVGKSYPFGSTYSYRLINCTVHYYTGSVTESSTLATGAATSPAFTQNGSGSTLYSAACDALIAKVTGTGASPANGSTLARVWVDAAQPVQYVKRHYQISPAVDGSGRVTLYFTDAEFSAFNTQSPAPPLLLPVSTDAGTINSRKANLLIERRPGSSSDNTGNPNTYSGTPQTIDPSDGDIVWNSSAGRWEVTFDVSGFSGFFVKTTSGILPLELLNFNGSRVNDRVKLQWQTAQETNTGAFIIERSTDGSYFTGIATLTAKGYGNNTYEYNDILGSGNPVYYRLKMTDLDNKYKYSKIIRITSDEDKKEALLVVYPSVIKGNTRITIKSNAEAGSKACFTDITGRMLKTITINNTFETVDISRFPAGIYILRLNNGVTQKIIKE
ncbi:T9SS type A sorting domain-containing protein [Niastella caeni]|nr:T9SS type A sorting domain-containing protein [Niastella caeni]